MKLTVMLQAAVIINVEETERGLEMNSDMPTSAFASVNYHDGNQMTESTQLAALGYMVRELQLGLSDKLKQLGVNVTLDASTPAKVGMA